MKSAPSPESLRGRAVRSLLVMGVVFAAFAGGLGACANAVIDDVASGDGGTSKGPPSKTTKGDDDEGDDDDGPGTTIPGEDAGPRGTDAGPGAVDGGNNNGNNCKQRVVINEVMNEGSDAEEFVELYNPYDCAVSLSGFLLKYQSKDPSSSTSQILLTFTAKHNVPSRGFFVIGTAGVSKSDVTIAGGLGNAGGQVAIVDNRNQIVDGVGFGASRGDFIEKNTAPNPGVGNSIGRKSDGVDTDNNSADFKVFTSPTPGKSNN